MSRFAAALILFAGIVGQALASTRVTVADLERRLEAERGKPDAQIAQRLTDLELTERLSDSTLARLEASSPGAETTKELKLLADQSAFLSLPTSEIPTIATPDTAAQRQMMGLVVNYVSKTIHQLPNFYAKRVTTHFEETPQNQTGTAAIAYRPLHQVSGSEVTVLYRQGQEVVDDGRADVKASDASTKTNGLKDWGVFGPILSMVVLDAARNTLAWSHWEEGAPGGRRAVFRYAVPTAKSHYRVNYCCVPEVNPGTDPPAHSNRIAGYHGEITVDPETGAILKLTLEADLKPTDPISVADIMVEYGPVEIGGQTYICAKRSIAFSTALSVSHFNGDSPGGFVIAGGYQKLLNDVAFVDYHMFRADARIVMGDEAGGQGAAANEAASPTQQLEEKAQPVAADAGTVAVAAEQSAAAQRSLTKDVPSAEAREPGKDQGASPNKSTINDQRAEQATDQAAYQAPVFKTTTREVVVDVVATRKNGEAVLGLGKGDFAVSENGKPQTISFFEEHTGKTAPSEAPEMPPLAAGMRTNVPPAPPGGAINVLLIDTLNTGTQDQAYLNSELLKFLAGMQPGTRMAIFVLGSKLRCIQGFTSDNAALLAAVRDPRNGLSGEKSTFLKTPDDRANDAEVLSTLQTMQASPYAIASLRSAMNDAGARDVGVRASVTFEALMYLGQYLAGVPGRKNLMWFAGSFPIVIFPSADQLARMKENPAAPGLTDRVKRTADLFTVSQIAVYPINTEGMMTEHVGEADSASPSGPGDIGHMGSQTDSVMSPFAGGATERGNAVNAMERLAASTGGKAYFNSNDLSAAMRRAIDDGSDYYTIGYSPSDAKMDGSYRQVEVKLSDGKVKLSYRHGYNADDRPFYERKAGVDPLTPLLQLGLPDTTGILYGADAVRAEVQPSPADSHAGQNPNLTGALIRYTVNFAIRSQDLVFEPGANGRKTGKVLIGLKAYDRDGNALNWEGDEETIDFDPNQSGAVQQDGVHVHLNFDLPVANDIKIVTAVYDLNSGTAGTLEIPPTPDPETKGSTPQADSRQPR